MYAHDIEYPIHEHNCSYTIVSHHRNKKSIKEKSLWEIDEKTEMQCFIIAIGKNWKSAQRPWAWGLHIVDARWGRLGITVDNEPSRWAKFVENGNCWHGYPADRTKPQDRPETRVLQEWKNASYISKSEMNKIQQQKL